MHLAGATMGLAQLQAAPAKRVPHSGHVALVDLVSVAVPQQALGFASMVKHLATASQLATLTPIVHPVRFALLTAVALKMFASVQHSVAVTHCAFVIGSSPRFLAQSWQPSAMRAF